MTATSSTERLDPWRAAALRDLLGVEADVTPGAALPLLWHWVYLLDHPRHADLGVDGHRARPEAERHLRRMWAGGRVSQRGPLRTDRVASRVSRETGRVTKHGSSGDFVVVTVGHTISQDGAVVVDEEQHLVLREPTPGPAGTAGDGGPPAGVVTPPEEGERSWAADERLLFRYSALTYNGHRIHYDQPYATGVEGYRGLVVHGPLQALLMAEHASARTNPQRAACELSYRLVAPLTVGQGLVTGGREEAGGTSAYVRDDSGRTTATGRYRLLGRRGADE
ncbi:mesaconyl-C4 CoA hydratase [Phycicoccus endophyticus]|uniref:Mesaconyl-C4 CoA hydratase n=1 Tax=Phycicoccus endophyticus TaxID=1690220 RepID=A0A7G9QZD3_9MICO|nr:mesaconyl-C4 CoA hydratase [Phycicoccus endophyticus]NHI19064.1 mesaconyl-C4 CoA hydratase [Phycicoccus endophyticus]QNN48708.1 mesaconyl-C4 CoA hydratase [Phycicoccus endophyticus]GGL32558.1 hypothetical protein GCM10012283_13630 [Phycicoccus endophyticus]